MKNPMIGIKCNPKINKLITAKLFALRVELNMMYLSDEHVYVIRIYSITQCPVRLSVLYGLLGCFLR